MTHENPKEYNPVTTMWPMHGAEMNSNKSTRADILMNLNINEFSMKNPKF